uniref:Uncharacterized protein n=1 Tax=Sus scrofa TaxID=9823 RepID=A0A4X1V877_PIG
RKESEREWMCEHVKLNHFVVHAFCEASTYCVLNTVPPLEDDHGNGNSSHVNIYVLKKLLECLLKCSSLPKKRHCWNTNERSRCGRPFGFFFSVCVTLHL